MGTTTTSHKHQLSTHIRVWVYWHDSPTLIRIPLDGTEIVMQESKATDEGYNHCAVSYHIEDGRLFRDVFSRGSDCDGVIDFCRTDFCAVQEIPPSSRMEFPEYTRLSSAQYDRQAEMAGY